MTVYDCLELMVQDSEDEKFKNILKTVADKLSDVYFLHCAMEESGSFPGYAIGMVQVGETLGRLPEVLLF
ncbi:MAG: type II secretion system F family protein [Eubacterium sp.]